MKNNQLYYKFNKTADYYGVFLLQIVARAFPAWILCQ